MVGSLWLIVGVVLFLGKEGRTQLMVRKNCTITDVLIYEHLSHIACDHDELVCSDSHQSNFLYRKTYDLKTESVTCAATGEVKNIKCWKDGRGVTVESQDVDWCTPWLKRNMGAEATSIDSPYWCHKSRYVPTAPQMDMVPADKDLCVPLGAYGIAPYYFVNRTTYVCHQTRRVHNSGKIEVLTGMYKPGMSRDNYCDRSNDDVQFALLEEIMPDRKDDCPAMDREDVSNQFEFLNGISFVKKCSLWYQNGIEHGSRMSFHDCQNGRMLSSCPCDCYNDTENAYGYYPSYTPAGEFCLKYYTCPTYGNNTYQTKSGVAACYSLDMSVRTLVPCESIVMNKQETYVSHANCLNVPRGLYKGGYYDTSKMVWMCKDQNIQPFQENDPDKEGEMSCDSMTGVWTLPSCEAPTCNSTMPHYLDPDTKKVKENMCRMGEKPSAITYACQMSEEGKIMWNPPRVVCCNATGAGDMVDRPIIADDCGNLPDWWRAGNGSVGENMEAGWRIDNETGCLTESSRCMSVFMMKGCKRCFYDTAYLIRMLVKSNKIARITKNNKIVMRYEKTIDWITNTIHLYSISTGLNQSYSLTSEMGQKWFFRILYNEKIGRWTTWKDVEKLLGGIGSTILVSKGFSLASCKSDDVVVEKRKGALEFYYRTTATISMCEKDDDSSIVISGKFPCKVTTCFRDRAFGDLVIERLANNEYEDDKTLGSDYGNDNDYSPTITTTIKPDSYDPTPVTRRKRNATLQPMVSMDSGDRSRSTDTNGGVTTDASVPPTTNIPTTSRIRTRISSTTTTTTASSTSSTDSSDGERDESRDATSSGSGNDVTTTGRVDTAAPTVISTTMSQDRREFGCQMCLLWCVSGKTPAQNCEGLAYIPNCKPFVAQYCADCKKGGC